ncbi:protein of unknown function [Shewanella benthica]|uniref:Uncharacterized protein n=1 Tax=Shewanella benthica TaxID=43661 RepID=A0A330M4B5_9GAMM|nr:protein of unknown function [Shewanella benthica]
MSWLKQTVKLMFYSGDEIIQTILECISYTRYCQDLVCFIRFF